MCVISNVSYAAWVHLVLNRDAQFSRRNVTDVGRPEIEKVLRAAGLSHRQARKLLAKGWAAVAGERQAELAELEAKLLELRERITT